MKLGVRAGAAFVSIVAGGLFAVPQVAYAATPEATGVVRADTGASSGHVGRDVAKRHPGHRKSHEPGGSGYGNGAAPGATAVPSHRPHPLPAMTPSPRRPAARPTKTPTPRPSGSSVSPSAAGLVPRPGMPAKQTNHAVVLDSAPESATDVVLTAAWDAVSVSDHISDSLLIHLDRADSTSAASGMAFTVTLPAGLTIANSTADISCTGTTTVTSGGSTIAASGVTMAIGVGQCTITAIVSSDTSGTYPLSSSSVSGLTGIVNGLTSTPLTVTPATSQVRAAFSPTTISAGATSTLTVRLLRTDLNMSTSASGLGLRITLPANLSVSSAGANSCGGTVGATGQIITIAGAALPNGPTDCSFTVVVTSSVAALYRLMTSTMDNAVGVVNAFNRGGCAATEGTGVVLAPACLPSLRVNKVAQTVTFAQPADYSISKHSLTAPATSTSGLAVTLTSTTSSVCTVSGDTITLVAPGTCTIDADQAGTDMYSAATTVARSFAVGTATAPPSQVVATAGVSSITVTWTAPSDVTGLTGYTAVAEPGPATCTTTGALTCVLGGTAGTTYTITVVANSSRGDSAAAGPSNEATPTAPVLTSTPPDTTLVLTTDKGLITTAEPSQDIVVIGTGFAAHSTATIVIYSNPTTLGTVVTDALGNFSKPVTVPATLAVGQHTLIAAGVDPSGNPHSMKLALRVAAQTTGSAGGTALAVTGAPIDAIALTGIALLLTGSGLSTMARRRRSTT